MSQPDFPSQIKVFRYSMQRIIPLILALSVSTPSCLVAKQKNSTRTSSASRATLIANMKSAVIQISYRSDPPVPNAAGIAGTGFLVNKDGYALTAAHVITQTKNSAQASGAKNVQFIAGISYDH